MEAQEKVQRSIRAFITTVDKRFLRSMDREMHLCAAEACNDLDASTERVRAEMERCQQKNARAHNYMQSEMQRFQVRKEGRPSHTTHKR